MQEDCEIKGGAEVKETVQVSLDACDLQCPGPIRRVFEEIGKMEVGQILEVKASDPGFKKDIAAWCDKTGNALIRTEFDESQKVLKAYIQKGYKEVAMPSCQVSSKADSTGAASMGKEVTMFFTFWGLNVLKGKDKPKVHKNTMEKMFDVMLPSHTGKLPLSKMNMAGMGPEMIKQIMQKHNVDDIDTLIQNVMNMGVKMVACTMSMELMGIKKEEFIEGVDLGGVAAYLGAADDSNINLFI